MGKAKKDNVLVQCYKCHHRYFVSDVIDFVETIDNQDCPNCGQMGEGTWILVIKGGSGEKER